MDFMLPEETRMIRATARQFIQREVLPLEREYLQTEQIDRQTVRGLQLKAKEIGLWALGAPQEHGGAGLGPIATTILQEECHRTAVPFNFGGAAPRLILHLGTPWQIERYYKRAIAEDIRFSIAFTEPSGGSDLQHIKTRAVRDGDDWVINGGKIFISGGQEADVIQVLTVTDAAKGGRGGQTWFLVERSDPGFKVARVIPVMGPEFTPTELVFDEVRVPDSRRLGPLGSGFHTANTELAEGRLAHAAWACGMADRSLEDSIAYAKTRSTWGELLATRQAIQWMLADSAIELHAARLMYLHCAWLAEQGLPIRNEAFYAKQYASEVGLRVTDRAIQIHGGYGYSKDLPYQLFYRNCRLYTIGHGTSEINRWVIARNLLSGRCPINLIAPL